MTTYDYGAPSAPDVAANGDGGSAKEQVQHAAATAAEQAKHVAEVASDEAGSVAADAREEAGRLLGDVRDELREQSRTQLDSLVGMLQGLASDLESMTRGEGAGSGMARDLVTQAGDKARALSSQLSGREPSEVLDQARDFARRRPGTFLLGALAAGVVAGRLARGATTSTGGGSATPAMRSETPSAPAPTTGTTGMTGMTGMTGTAGTAAGTPLAGTAQPAETPVYPQGATPGGTL